MKKIITVMISVVLALGVFAGCSNSGGEKENPGNASNVTLEEIHTAVKEAYGENYLPNMEIPAEMLEAEFGLTKDLYTEVKAEQPMISTHADRVVIVKAAEGKADAVEKALVEAREKKVNDTMQYPMNLAKIAATKVLRNGDYVAFLLVGAIYEAEEVTEDDAKEIGENEVTEEDAKEFAEKEVEKAVEAFNNLFK